MSYIVQPSDKRTHIGSASLSCQYRLKWAENQSHIGFYTQGLEFSYRPYAIRGHRYFYYHMFTELSQSSGFFYHLLVLCRDRFCTDRTSNQFTNFYDSFLKNSILSGNQGGIGGHSVNYSPSHSLSDFFNISCV